MRISKPLLLAALLAGCSAQTTRAAVDGEELIDCALAGAASFARDCAVERAEQDGAVMLVVHHPDGGFRRFELNDGTGLATADGADVAQIKQADGLLEVSVGPDRYRFPYTAKANAPAK